MSDKKIQAVSTLVASVLSIPVSAVGADASMESIPKWDSLEQLKICLAFQEQFGMDMDMQTIAEATSVARLAALLPG
jgi:acyl carrier protein